MRRVFIFILLFLLVGGAVWYFFVRPNQTTTPTNSTSGFKSFFPSIVTGGRTTNSNTDTASGDTNTAPVKNSPFKQLTSRPIAGYTIFSTNTTLQIPAVTPKTKPTTQTIVNHVIRYIVRENGYVYEIKDGDIATQISNISIPNIYEGSFADNNNTAILRFLRDNNQTIATYTVPIPQVNPDGTRTQKEGTYFPDNILSLVVSPDTKQIASLILDKNGTTVYTANTNNANKKTITSSPFHGWILSWPSQKSVFLQTKAAASAPGFLYVIDQTTNKLRRLVGNTNGLTAAASPDEKYILYSESAGSAFKTSIYNTITGNTTQLSLLILPEKCAWLANDNLICAGNSSVTDSQYPDSWYAGVTHFTDQLYNINTTNNTYTVLNDGTNQSFDMTNLQVDESQNLLYFVDKSTGLLWDFKLNT